jgi:hypothetical protein
MGIPKIKNKYVCGLCKKEMDLSSLDAGLNNHIKCLERLAKSHKGIYAKDKRKK